MNYAILFVLTPMDFITRCTGKREGGGVIIYIHVTCDTIVIQQYISYSQWIYVYIKMDKNKLN